MIAILEWTLSNVQQNMEQLQTPTMATKIITITIIYCYISTHMRDITEFKHSF